MKIKTLMPILILSLLLPSLSVSAANLYWVGGAGGNISTASNWNTSDPGSCNPGAGDAGAAPGSSDLAIFDADCDNDATIDTSWSVQGLQIDSGYIGTVTQAVGNTLTIGSSHYLQNDGAFSGGDSSITLTNADFSLLGGTFTSTSATLTMSSGADRAWLNSGGTFNHNNGRAFFSIDGTTDPNLTFNGSTSFYDLELRQSNTANFKDMDITIDADTSIASYGTLTLSQKGATGNDDITITGGDLVVKSDLVIDNSAGGYILGDATLVFNGTGAQLVNGTTGVTTSSFPAIKIDKPSGTLSFANDIITSSNWTYVQGDVDLTSTPVWFRSNSKTIYLNGSMMFEDLKIERTSTGSHADLYFDIAASTILTVNGDLTLISQGSTSSDLYIQTGTLAAKKDIHIQQTTTSSSIRGDATLLINGTVDQLLNGDDLTPAASVPNLEINKSSGTLTLQNTIITDRDWTYVQGTINPGTSLVMFRGESVTRNINGNMLFNDLTFSRPSTGNHGDYHLNMPIGTELTVNGDLLFTNKGASSADLNINTGTIFCRGDVTVDNVSGILGGSAKLEFSGSNNQNFDLNASELRYDLTGGIYVNKTGGMVQLASDMTLDKGAGNILILENGSFGINGHDLSSTTNFEVHNGATFALDGDETFTAPTRQSRDTVMYTGNSGPYSLQAWTYHNLSINGTAGTFNMVQNIDMTGNLSILAGTLDATVSNYDINLEGDWFSSGTFTSQSASVIFDGLNQVINGTTSFYNFTKVESSDDSSNEVLSFSPSSSTTITGTWTLDGRDGDDEIVINSTSTGNLWDLYASGTEVLDYVKVQDSKNLAPSIDERSDTTVVDNGNNFGWLFNGMPLQDYVWMGTSNGNWNTAANWSNNAVPGSSDMAIFNGDISNVSANINTNASVEGIKMIHYYGTLTQLSGYTLTTDSDGFYIYDGTFVGGDSTIDVNRPPLFLESGSFTSTSGRLEIGIGSPLASNETLFDKSASASFSHNNGTISFAASGSSCSTLTYIANAGGGVEFYDFELNMHDSGCNGVDTWGLNTTDNGDVTVAHDVNLIDGRIVGDFYLTGNLNLLAEPDGYTGTVHFIGTTDQEYSNNGTGYAPNIIIDKSNGTVMAANGTTDFKLVSLTINNGTFIAPSNDMTLTNSSSTYKLNLNNGSFFHSNGTVIVNPVHSSSCSGTYYYVNGDFVFYNFTAASSDTGGCNSTKQFYTSNTSANGITVLNDFYLSKDRLAGIWNIYGDYSTSADASSGSAVLNFYGNANQSYQSETAARTSGDIFVKKNGGTLSLVSNGDWDAASQDLYIQGGTFYVNGLDLLTNNLYIENGATLKLDGDEVLTISSTSFSSNSTVLYAGTSGPYTLQNWGYSNLSIDANGSTFNLPANLDINGDLQLLNGTLDATASNYDINVAGNWLDQASFTARSATVSFDGSNQIINGTTSFYDLTLIDGVDDASHHYINFTEGKTITVTNTWTLDGLDANDKVILQSTNPGSQWSIDPQVTRTIDYVLVTDSNNINATAIDESADATVIDGGNNTNWLFVALQNFTWLGFTSSDWADGANWVGGSKPGGSDTAYFNGDVSTEDAALNFDTTLTAITIFDDYSGTITASNGAIISFTNFTQDGGTFNAGDSYIISSNDFRSNNSGGFQAGTSTLKLLMTSGTYTIDVKVNGSALNDLYVDLYLYGDLDAENDLKVNGDLTFKRVGDFTGNIHARGDIKLLDDVISDTGHLYVDGTTDQSMHANGSVGDLNHLTIDKSSGTLTLSDEIKFGRNITHVQGTVVANGNSIITMDQDSGTTTQTINGNGLKLNDLKLNYLYGKLYAYDTAVTGNMKILDWATIYDGEIYVQGDLMLQESDMVWDDLDLIFNGNGDQTISAIDGAGDAHRIVIDKPAGTLYLQDTIDLAAELTYVQGDVDPGSSTIRLKHRNSPTTQTTYINGNDLMINNLYMDDSIAYYNFSSKLIVNGDTDIVQSQRYDGTGSLEMRGDVNITAGSEAQRLGSVTFVLGGSRDQHFSTSSGNLSRHQIYINKPAGSVILGSTWDHDASTGSTDDLFIQNGSLVLNGFDLTVGDRFELNNSSTLVINGNETITSPDLISSTSTVVYDGNGRTYTMQNWSYANLTIDANGSTVELPANLNIDANLNILEGSLDVTVSDYSVNIFGDWTQSAVANFNARSAAVIFDGNGQSINGDISFYDLSKSDDDDDSTSDVWTFTAGKTVTVLNDWTVNGLDADDRVILASSNGGVQWNIDPQGARNIDFSGVSDSNNVNAGIIDESADASVLDSGNNTNWSFVSLLGYTWLGYNSALWSEAANWAGGSVPGSSQMAWFNGEVSIQDVSIDTNASVKGVHIDSDYTGTITQLSTYTLTVASNGYYQYGGTFIGGDADIYSKSPFYLNGGTFTSTTATLDLDKTSSSDETIFFFANGSTFNHNNGLVFFDPNGSVGCGGADSNIDISGVVNFYDLRIDPTDSGTCGSDDRRVVLLNSETAVVQNDFTFSDGQFTGTWILKGDLFIEAGAASASGQIKMTGNGDQFYSQNGSAMSSLALDKSNGDVMAANGITSFSINNLHIYNGDFYAPTGTLKVRDNSYADENVIEVHNGGNFFHNNGEVNFNPAGGTCSAWTYSIDVNGSIDFYDLNINEVESGSCGADDWYVSHGAGDRINVLNGFTFTDGRLLSDWYLQGDVLIKTTAVGTSGSLKLVGPNNQTYLDEGGDEPNGDFYINKSAGTVTMLSNGDWNSASQDLYLQGGSLATNGNAIKTNNLYISNGASLYLIGSENNSFTDIFSSASHQYYIGENGTYSIFDFDYGHLTINGNNSSFNLQNNLNVNSNLNLLQGNLETTASNFNINLLGDWRSAGSADFIERSATVTLNGADQSIYGSNTFFNLTKIDSANDDVVETLSVEAGTTQVINGSMSFNGLDNGDRLTINSLTNGTEFSINPKGTISTSYLSVKDSYNINGVYIKPTNSINLNNTMYWFSTKDAWDFKVKITIPASSVNGDLTEFPVFIDLNGLASIGFFDSVDVNGADIRVTKADENSDLPIEIVAIDTANASGELWFRAHELSATSNNEFCLYYGNSEATAFTSNGEFGSEAVWSNGYTAVLHLNDSPSATVYDSTSYNNDASPSGSMNGQDLVTGKLGKAIDFDGLDDYLRIADDLSLDNGTQFELSAWAKFDVIDNDTNYTNARPIVSKYYSNPTYSRDSHLLIQRDSKFQFDASDGTGADYELFSSPDPVITGSWQQVKVIYDAGDLRLYHNGVQSANATLAVTNIGNSTEPFDIGNWYYDDNASYKTFDGMIDEVRLSKATRSAAWVKTEYDNQANPSSFYNTGNAEANLGTYQHSALITIRSSQINGDLTNFPVYVNLAHMPNNFFSSIKANGADIRVTKADRVSFQAMDLVGVDTGNGRGELWFKADFLSSSTDTDFYIFYGNNGANALAATSSYGAHAVWPAYDAVWHMNEDPAGSAPQIIDSAANSYPGTSNGSMASNDLVLSRLGNAVEFDGGDDFIDFGNFGAYDNGYTLSTWFKTNSASSNVIFHRGQGSTCAYNARISSNLADEAGCGSFNIDLSAKTLDDNKWHYLSLTRNGQAFRAYVDGVFFNSSSSVNTATEHRILMGAEYYNTGDYRTHFNGSIDETHIIDEVKNADWIYAEYLNQRAPENFYLINGAIPGSERDILFDWGLF